MKIAENNNRGAFVDSGKKRKREKDMQSAIHEFVAAVVVVIVLRGTYTCKFIPRDFITPSTPLSCGGQTQEAH